MGTWGKYGMHVFSGTLIFVESWLFTKRFDLLENLLTDHTEPSDPLRFLFSLIYI